MIVVPDNPAALVFLDLFWAEVQRQAAATAPKEKRDVQPSRHAQPR